MLATLKLKYFVMQAPGIISGYTGTREGEICDQVPEFGCIIGGVTQKLISNRQLYFSYAAPTVIDLLRYGRTTGRTPAVLTRTCTGLYTPGGGFNLPG